MDTVIESVVETLVVPVPMPSPSSPRAGSSCSCSRPCGSPSGSPSPATARLDEAWRRLRGLPIVIQALAWLLFLPVLAGLLVWRAGWPLAGRLVAIGAIAGWNLLVFLPQPI